MSGFWKTALVTLGTTFWGVVVHYVGASAPEALPTVHWATGLVSALVTALPAAIFALFVHSPRNA